MRWCSSSPPFPLTPFPLHLPFGHFQLCVPVLVYCRYLDAIRALLRWHEENLFPSRVFANICIDFPRNLRLLTIIRLFLLLLLLPSLPKFADSFHSTHDFMFVLLHCAYYLDIIFPGILLWQLEIFWNILLTFSIAVVVSLKLAPWNELWTIYELLSRGQGNACSGRRFAMVEGRITQIKSHCIGLPLNWTISIFALI